MATARAREEGGGVALLEMLGEHRPAFTRDAACIEFPAVDFFPTRHQHEATAAAIAVCERCLVRSECLAFAVETAQHDGIWGGLTELERRGLQPVVEKPCELPECTTSFVPCNRGQRCCCARHARTLYKRETKARRQARSHAATT